MQKAKHAFKRPPLKNVLNGLLWTRFRFLHGVVQSIPQGVALESERFLLFPPHHNSNVQETS
ncbi:hypothetical protein C7R94_17030 [Brevibacillus sp. NRRL NRS-603]|nr:hypothetical protein C7R94_17030 [Brevibacillus sp. NRRL NRS-603]